MSENVSNIAAASILVLLVIAALALIIISRRSRRIERDRRLAELWDWMQQQDGVPGQGLARVVRVYQRARRGSKAIIEWADKSRQDAWFYTWYPSQGSYVVIVGRVGYGPHNGDPNVVYVDQNGVIGSAPAETPAAWRRHRARLEKAGK